LGHDKGDDLLKQVTRQLLARAGKNNTVARLGGNEFAVILEGLSQTVQGATSHAQGVAADILQALNHTYQLGESRHHSTVSIGIAMFDGTHRDSTEVPMQQVELAMHHAKVAGHNSLRFFDPIMQSVAAVRAALEISLRDALENRQFELYYQPQVEGAHDITGVEALVRWIEPVRGVISPEEFIPLAEETGLILPLGQWVLETACIQLQRWAHQPEFAELTVAVNVSARQFHQKDFIAQVLAVLARTGANPERLKLELTESLLVSSVEEVIAKMNALKGIGVGFSLDDFGTGYSSLSYLKRLPLSQLKIDQGFVRDILDDANDAAIAKMVIALANSLGLGVIAEGVETEAQRIFLEQLGCHAFQGYLFSRPIGIDALETYVRNQPP
jgi:diguanylate cyclase (GGDEF)-like protein